MSDQFTMSDRFDVAARDLMVAAIPVDCAFNCSMEGRRPGCPVCPEVQRFIAAALRKAYADGNADSADRVSVLENSNRHYIDQLQHKDRLISESFAAGRVAGIEEAEEQLGATTQIVRATETVRHALDSIRSLKTKGAK